MARDVQARLWWDTTPVDVFLDTTFKAFFNRTRDWADLEAMQAPGALGVAAVAGVLTTFLSGNDERIARLLAL